MYCLNCGKTADFLLCPECRSREVLREIYSELNYFNEEHCTHPYVQKFIHSLAAPDVPRNYVPKLLELFDISESEYCWCQYYKSVNDSRYENQAIHYLDNHSLTELQTQRILYGLIDYYLPNNYTKPGKWCKLIKDRKDLAFELYTLAADYYSRIGDYVFADELLDRAEEMISDADFYVLWPKRGIDEIAKKKVEKLRTKNAQYRSKPYWPIDEEHRRALAPFYEERGIHYMRITKMPDKIHASEFEPICEAKELPPDYCAFWCTEVNYFTYRQYKEHNDICQIAAVRVRNGEIEEVFESLIRPWSNSSISAAECAGVEVETILDAAYVDQVITRFYEFVGTDVLMSTDALSNQGKLLARATRYTGMRRIPNAMYDLRNYASEISPLFNSNSKNTRDFLLSYFNMSEGENALEKAIKNVELYQALCNMDQ